MAKTYPDITPELADWIREQHVFFVATAPTAADGHVNCSPMFVTTAFCAFDGAQKIVRLHGRGGFITPACAERSELSAESPDLPGARAIVVVDVTRVADACGYGVPNYEYMGERKALPRFGAEAGTGGSDCPAARGERPQHRQAPRARSDPAVG